MTPTGAPPSSAAAADWQIESPPSLVTLAARALRDMILSGQLSPGDRVVENRLTGVLNISRPPLREAMRVLEQEGLIVQVPRRGAIVTPLSLDDVYEIFSFREELERMAVQIGVPVRTPARLQRCRDAFAALEQAAADDSSARVTERGFDFHVAVVGLAGHRRLEEAFRSLAMQMRLCMGMNRQARRSRETLRGDAERHRRILSSIEEGDAASVQDQLRNHGHRTFLVDAGGSFPGGSPQSLEWLESVRREESAAAGADVAEDGR